MIEALLHRIEADVLGLLDDEIAPPERRTRRCASFVPDRTQTLDVYALDARQTGPVTTSEATIEVHLRGSVADSNSTFALDMARWMVATARDRMLTAKLPWNGDHRTTNYNLDTAIDNGLTIVVYEAIVELVVRHRSNAPNTLGVVTRVDGASEFGQVVASTDARAIVVGRAGQYHSGPITAFYANAIGGDVVELLDDSGAVVTTAPAAVGPGLHSFDAAALPSGDYRVALSDGVTRVTSVGITHIFHPPGPPA